MKSKEFSHGNTIFNPRQQTLEKNFLHHLEWTGTFHSGQPVGAICADLAPDRQDRFGHGAGNRHPGWDAAQCSSWPVHRNAGRPLESSPDHADWLTASSLWQPTRFSVLFALDVVEVWHIYVVLFIRSLAGAFHGNAMSASTSLMVPVEQLTRIQGLNQLLNGGLNVVAAPLGALLLGLLPMQGILSIDVITALFAILPLAFIHVPQPERNAVDAEKTTVWTDFKAGLRYMISWPGLLIIGLMTVGINFTIIPAFSLLPLMVKDYFGGSAIHLGWVESAMGAGMIIGGALLGVWGGFSRKILTSLVGLMGMGAGTLILALAPSSAISLAVGGALLVGLMTPMTMGPFFAVIQSTVEPDMQARIFSLLSSVGTGIVTARIDDRWSRRRSGRNPGLVPAWRHSVHPYGGDRFIHPRRDEHGKER